MTYENKQTGSSTDATGLDAKLGELNFSLFLMNQSSGWGLVAMMLITLNDLLLIQPAST